MYTVGSLTVSEVFPFSHNHGAHIREFTLLMQEFFSFYRKLVRMRSLCLRIKRMPFWTKETDLQLQEMSSRYASPCLLPRSSFPGHSHLLPRPLPPFTQTTPTSSQTTPTQTTPTRCFDPQCANVKGAGRQPENVKQWVNYNYQGPQHVDLDCVGLNCHNSIL